MLHYHRARNPDGPYQPALCQSPDEHPSGRWYCSARKVDALRREARQLTAKAYAYLRSLADPETQVRQAAREFGIPEADFVRVIRCESNMNPRAVNRSSGALGLGQHLPRYWRGRAAALGYDYDDWSDARANARVSAWLWATSGPQHWVCY